MPSLDTLEAYARRVEDEMSVSVRAGGDEPRTSGAHRATPNVRSVTANARNVAMSFPKFRSACGRADCGSLNPVAATGCHACGASMTPAFSLTLDEALRTGAIIRGMDIDEEEVRHAEKIAPVMRGRVLRSGDQKLVRILRVLPDESWARLRDIMVTG